jgi:molybdopterin-guanine dinucleotide biosynthesis protein A
LLVGLFVGGRGERLGGVPKGLLKAPNAETTLSERALAELRAALPGAEIVLVGEATAYASLGLRAVADAPAGVGPLGGLLGLLAEAEARGAAHVLTLACDLPFIEQRLLARLSTETPEAAALVTVTDGVRNPLIARYAIDPTTQAARAVLSAGKRSLQAVLDALEPGVAALTLSEAEAASLVDWDTPDDVERRQ